MKKTIKLIGLTGTNGAGKGIAAGFFKKKGYEYFSLSDLIRDELKKIGQKETRNNLIKMGNALREKHSPDILARLVLKNIRQKAVIDSIRNPKEVEFLKKQKHFILLAIDAPVAVRYERVKKRGRDESSSTLEEFIAKEKEEMSHCDKGQQLQNCIKMADYVVINDNLVKDLYQKLERFL